MHDKPMRHVCAPQCDSDANAMRNDARGRGRELRNYSPTIPTSSTVPALLATLAGWLTGITQRLTDRHRPCRRNEAELAALVTAERDRQRRAVAEIRSEVHELGFDDAWRIRGRLRKIADDLEGPAPNPLTGLDLSNPQAPTNPSAGNQ